MDKSLIRVCSTCRHEFVSRLNSKGNLYKCCSICILHRCKAKNEVKIKVCRGIWRFCFSGDKLVRQYDTEGNEI